jgi:hypothetical protein
MQPFNRISKRLFTCLLIYLSTHQSRSTILNGFVENKPNQTQFKPKTNPFLTPKTTPKAKTNPFFPAKNPHQSQNKPNQTQSQTGRPRYSGTGQLPAKSCQGLCMVAGPERSRRTIYQKTRQWRAMSVFWPSRLVFQVVRGSEVQLPLRAGSPGFH